MAKAILMLQACLALIAHDVFMSRHDFASLHYRVKRIPLRPVRENATASTDVSFALDVVCCLYPKRVLCLQRSAVLVRMLRTRGIHAQMVIGVQKLPFKAHAWVEVDGQIVNDRLASRERFLVLEVC
ncbi:MAG: lasso peptide biosynthesis B2 protein [Terracidiphilus sp.]